jgi:hypothetical protein
MKPTKGPSKPKNASDKPKKPFRTRTYHRTDEGGPTGGFDKSGAEDRSPRPERPFRPAPRPYAARPPRPAPFEHRPAPLPAAPASAAGEFALTLPLELGKRLEAHASALGIDTQALVRVWLSDKLRPQK